MFPFSCPYGILPACEDAYARAMEILALTKLEAAVLGHVCPLNCMFVWGWFFLVSVENEF